MRKQKEAETTWEEKRKGRGARRVWSPCSSWSFLAFYKPHIYLELVCVDFCSVQQKRSLTRTACSGPYTLVQTLEYGDL